MTEDSNSKGLSDLVKDIAAEQVDDAIERDKILDHLLSIISSTECSTIGGLISAVSTASERFEQEMEKDKVNIMTMHKAKGLTAKAVIIMSAEDEHIPGKEVGGLRLEDERRLLYVSLSRAEHYLAITYCERRIQQQSHLGRHSGRTTRQLTRFLRDAPVSH